jgi:Ca-activated chloride channel family protein
VGVGDDYNEDLMQAMARAGDGNYYFIDNPRNLPEIFGAELSGLVATVGTGVTLRLDPQNGASVAEVLNEFEPAGEFAHRLPNIVAGMPADVVLKLHVPPREQVSEVLRVRLDWDPTSSAERETLAHSLILPSVAASDFDAMPENQEVREHIALLEVAAAKLRASEAMARGDHRETVACLDFAAGHLAAFCEASPAMTSELEQITDLRTDFHEGNAARLSKRAKYQRNSRQMSRPVDPAGGPASPAPQP